MKFLLVSIALVFALAVYQAEARNLGMKARFNTWKARFGKKNEDPATEEKRSNTKVYGLKISNPNVLISFLKKN